MWDKEITKKLIDAGLSWEHARIAVGEIAEQRQIADLQGYSRGYNNGCRDTEAKDPAEKQRNEERIQRWEAFKAKLALNKLHQPEYFI